MLRVFHVLVILSVLFSPAYAAERPNVLMIIVDDLNDWVGCLGGHPDVKTPNIDKLAKRGLLFSSAHCAAPLCNPSRAAAFSGRQPFETGVFANNDSNIRKLRPDLVLIPQHFKQAGYRTFGTGKLLHQKSTQLFDEDFFPDQRWSPFAPDQVKYLDAERSSKGTANPRHLTELKSHQIVLPLNRMPSDRNPDTVDGESFDWGPLDVEDGDMGDGKIATWAVDRLRQKHDGPFFCAVGFYRPHIPLFAPKKYFDLYDDIALPEVKSDDLADLSATAREIAIAADTAGAHATVLKHGQWLAAVKAYLASTSFIDAQVGKLLDALDASPYAENTIVMLWSDHGWHLGEKQHWGKWTGWQRSTHVPLIIAPTRENAIGRFAIGATCPEPVSLLDLYPTLIELCGLPEITELSGKSLVPLLKDPSQQTNRVVLTTFDKGNYSVTGARWHYIRYASGSEELYNRETDPHEWHNLAGKFEHAVQQAELAKYLPDESAYPAPARGASGAKKKRDVK